MFGRLSILGVAAAALVIGTPQHSTAMPVAPLNAQVGDFDNVITVKNHNKGGGGKQAKGGKQVKHVNKTNKNVKNVKNVKHVNKTVVRRDVRVHRTVVVRPYRAWTHRPYYGAVIAGVTIGTVIAVSTPRVVPVLSVADPRLCWYWADPAEVRGYWDYCAPPL
jgi:hypothetical protein